MCVFFLVIITKLFVVLSKFSRKQVGCRSVDNRKRQFRPELRAPARYWNSSTHESCEGGGSWLLPCCIFVTPLTGLRPRMHALCYFRCSRERVV